MYGCTAYNRIVCASPPSGARLPQNRSRASPFVRFYSSTFFCARKMLRIFPYRAQKNVTYNRNVMRNTILNIIYE
jgi:hypothetical protein